MPRCKLLEKHICVTVDKSWRPCCRFNNFPHVDISQVSFKEYKNSDFYQKIIKDMEDGWANGCAKCKIEEERGHASLRKTMNRDLSESPDIEYIEVSLSNECNLACKMCNASYSTLWNKIATNNKDIIGDYHHTKTQSEIQIEEVFKDVDISKLKIIKYLGGEPFITPQIKDLLEYLDQRNLLENITFTCNTNATLFPKKLLKYFKKFKQFNLELSIDGIGEVNDYIRYGKPWSIIEKNIDLWQEYASQNTNIHLSLFTTVQAYNLHDIKNIVEFTKNRNIKWYKSLLHTPTYLSVNALPAKYLEEIQDEYNENFYKSITVNNQFATLIDYTRKVDQAQGTDIEKTIPLLNQYMEKENEKA